MPANVQNASSDLTILRTSGYWNWLASVKLIRGNLNYPRLMCMEEQTAGYMYRPGCTTARMYS